MMVEVEFISVLMFTLLMRVKIKEGVQNLQFRDCPQKSLVTNKKAQPFQNLLFLRTPVGHCLQKIRMAYCTHFTVVTLARCRRASVCSGSC